MEFTPEYLSNLETDDLVKTANLHFGLGVNKHYQRHDLINMILQSSRKFKGQAGIRVVSKGDSSPVPPGHVKVRVQPGKYDKVPRPIIVGHQFKMASIPVNRDVIIPNKYLTCLQDALGDTFFQDPDDPDRELVIQAEHAYSFSILERGPEIAPEPEFVPEPDDDPFGDVEAEDGGTAAIPSISAITPTAGIATGNIG